MNHNNMNNADNLLNAMMHIYRYKNEVEEKHYKDSNGQLKKIFVQTDRAVLANRKILLKDTIGKGSYSKVKGAFDIEKFQKVAVKVIDRSKAPKDFQEKFLPRELDVWTRVIHKNIIKMHDNFWVGRKIYMILEFAEGGDMLTHIQKLGGPVSDNACKMWIYQICDAVKYLHEHNIIHRDLKLENILLDANDNIKLCDFGFSKDLTKSNNELLSETYCGSKAYASPEILLGQPYDPKKADIWAIGVILYIFLTGNMPFKEDSCNQQILNQQKSLRLFWNKSNKISSTAKQLVKWMFTFEWTKRPDILDVVSNVSLLNNKEATGLNSDTINEYNLRRRNKLVKTIDHNYDERIKASS